MRVERKGPDLQPGVFAGRVTLVIPLRDEAPTLLPFLAALESQTITPRQIIFVDGGSRDGTVGLLQAWVAGHAASRLILTAGALPGEARNRGIDVATTEWVALLDAGTVPDPTWLEALITPLIEQPGLDVVYGNYEPITETRFERAASFAYVPPKIERTEGLIRGPSVASCLLRRSIWAKVGGFPAGRAGEDLIFLDRLATAGAQTGWAPTATVWWRLRPDLRSTYQRFRLYSEHNIRAGLQRYWHHGIARQYLVYGLLLGLAVLDDPWWVGAIVGLFVLRAGKRIWRRREGAPLGSAWRWIPSVAVLLLAIDLATFHGWLEALLPKGAERENPAGSPTDR
jgi:glycosyltransferase involved in cell wall biosynthesis